MLIGQIEFEHVIEEEKLKKGLRLFHANKIELIQRSGNNLFTFLIREKPAGEIVIKTRSGKINEYDCYCSDKNYCAHLAAAIFYLQKEKLELAKLKTGNRNTNKKRTITGSKKTGLEKNIKSIKAIIKPYTSINKLKADQLKELVKKINLEKNSASLISNILSFNLAVVLELTKVPNISYTEQEDPLSNLIRNTKKEIELSFYKPLASMDREAFIASAFHALRSQPNFSTGIFSFLIPKAAVLIKDKNDIRHLITQLKKRRQNKNSLDPIDRKLVAELQLAIMDAKLNHRTYSLKKHEATLELPIALAELEFCNRNNAKAFKTLEQFAETIKDKNKNKYIDLIDEILKLAQQKNNTALEINYLVNKFVYGYFIDEKSLQRFIELTKAGGETALNELVDKLRSDSVFFNFEKLAIVLLKQNKLDELLDEIKKEKNKFKLLNKIAVQKLPAYTQDLLQLYLKHLLEAITEARFPYFQQQIIDQAKKYFDLLPTEARNKMVENLKKKMIYDKYMLQHIEKLYPGLS